MANGAEIGRFVGLRVAAVVVAVAAAVLPCPPTAVERAYSTGIYPALQSALTRLSNLTSVALVDVLAVIIGVGWTGLLARDVVAPGREPQLGALTVRALARGFDGVEFAGGNLEFRGLEIRIGGVPVEMDPELRADEIGELLFLDGLLPCRVQVPDSLECLRNGDARRESQDVAGFLDEHQAHFSRHGWFS